MHRSIIIASVIASLSLGACATPQQAGLPQQQMPFHAARGSLGSASIYSTEDSEYSYSKGGKGLSVPHRVHHTDAVDLIVRPDAITVEFAIRDVRPTSPEALAATRKTSADILDQVNKATGGTASQVLRGVAAMKVFRPGEPDEKGIRHREFAGVEVTVDGLIEVTMAKELGFWERSQLFVTMLELTTRIAEQAESKDEPLRTVSFETPTPSVKDPEAYRATLTERWVAQARAFAVLAQAKESPLVLVDCLPPQTITQVKTSLEEVTLQLPLNCHIDVADRRGTSPPARPKTREE